MKRFILSMALVLVLMGSLGGIALANSTVGYISVASGNVSLLLGENFTIEQWVFTTGMEFVEPAPLVEPKGIGGGIPPSPEEVFPEPGAPLPILPAWEIFPEPGASLIPLESF